MNEMLYDQNSASIVAGLLLGMLSFIEAGYRIGMHRHQASTEEIRSQVNAILAAQLGLLALLLGFTFSLALQRYDDRSRAVVAEANAIGTAYLRADLLAPEVRADIRAGLRQYLELRIREGRVNLAAVADHNALMEQTALAGQQLWRQAVRAGEADPRAAIVALYIQSLNEVLDSADTRKAALDRHVPETVILLMFATFMLASATLGYASGISGHRVTLPAVLLVLLIALVVYLVIDLDRPRRGLIQVDQQSLRDLRPALGIPPSAPDAPPVAAPAQPR